MNLNKLDIITGFRKKHIWLNIAKTEIKFKFKRTKLGPLWITVGTGIFIIVLSIITGAFFGSDFNERVPWITTGLILWSFIFSTLSESCGVFGGRVGLIQNVPMEKSVLIYVMISKSIITLLFNFILFFICLIIFKIQINSNILYFIPGFLILTGNIFFLSIIISILATRFRDLAPIISSLLTVLFFLTPVWWNAEYFPERAKFVIFNLFHHLLEITRKPLLGEIPNFNSWLVAIVMLLIFAVIAVILFEKKKRSIPYWV